MATKYNRDTDTSEGIERRRTPWMRQGPPQHRLSSGQRVFILFMGLAVVCLLGQIAYQLNVAAPFVFQSVERGEATIQALSPAVSGAGVGAITVKLVADGRKFDASWPIPEPYWSGLTVGNRVAVLYRISKSGDSMELLECGLVALPEPIR